jgi:2-oxoglutarate/2-oxoacid ferredoxin oxidoreductase subunit beta
MKPEDLNTKEENTWCPGCPNFGILEAAKRALAELVNEGKIKIKDTVVVTGIGCHAKTFDYLDINSFYGLHGRVLPIALGIKLGNPDLTVLGFGGDGDTYAEGLDHFIHNCRYNADLTMIVHNNQVFALTVGQATPVTETGFTSGSSPSEVKEKPLNPIALAIEANASFVARGFALDIEHLKNLMKEVILHKGFSFLEILQPCIVFHNTIPYFQKNVYKLDTAHDITNLEAALGKAREWDYCFNKDQKIPIGIFYKKERPLFKGVVSRDKAWYTLKRKTDWQKTIEDFR